MKRILLSLLTIASVGAIAFGVSTAFFSDTETSSGNTFQAGSLDLKINGQDNPSAIVSFEDLKPGDLIIEEKLLRVIDNPAKVWMHIKDIVSGQGTQTEPEELEEDGTPKHDLENYLSYDLAVGGNPLIATDSAVHFLDAFSCWIPLGILPGNEEVVVSQSFHFPSDVTNWAQGDILTFTEEFYAAQDRNNPDATPPDLGTDRAWSEVLKKCVSDLSSKHNLTFTCVTGCGGVYPHTVNMTAPDISTGNFTGSGNYIPDPAYTWDITAGNTSGASFSMSIIYTGLGAGYTVDLTGTVDASGNVAGAAVSSSAQTFTFVIN